MKVVLALAAVVASSSLLAPTVAHAQLREDLSASVAYGDLDLSTAAGQDRLKKRVAAAVRSMCADDGVREMSRRSQVSDCRANAQQAAMSQVQVAIAAREPRLAAR